MRVTLFESSDNGMVISCIILYFVIQTNVALFAFNTSCQHSRIWCLNIIKMNKDNKLCILPLKH